MDITPALAGEVCFVEGYGEGFLRVRGQVHEGALLVFPNRVVPWQPPSYENLTASDFAAVFAEAPEVLLLGVGNALNALPPAPLRQAFSTAKIVLEAMTTGAACRTYNVLLSEGRRVGLAVLV
jgi:uncharacterized protein